MGGQRGAKQRRTLQRLTSSSAQTSNEMIGSESSSPPPHSSSYTYTQKEKRQKKTYAHTSYADKKDRNKVPVSDIVRSKRKLSPTSWSGAVAGGSAGSTSTNKKKEKEKKKPKHLKRKLEAVTMAGDKVAQQIIASSIDVWERQKMDYSNPHKKYRQDTSTQPSVLSLDSEQAFVQNSKDNSTCTRTNASSDPAGALNHGNDQQVSRRDHESLIQSTSSIVVVTHNESNNNKNVPLGTSSSDSDSDDDGTTNGNISSVNLVRQRGKRRKGRADSSRYVQEQNRQQSEEMVESQGFGDKKNSNYPGPTQLTKRQHDDQSDHGTNNNNNNNNKRYCIGRKPVTDFTIGQCYPGKVVYVRPFGIFLDIGCHSDAFCHVSRLQDGFLDSPESLFKVGDAIPKARVVEIDRTLKRITVSLQSEQMVETERTSIEARQARLENRNQKRQTPNTESTSTIVHKEQSIIVNEKLESPPSSLPTQQESEMTTAEARRARKLARRAARRQASLEPGQ